MSLTSRAFLVPSGLRFRAAAPGRCTGRRPDARRRTAPRAERLPS